MDIYNDVNDIKKQLMEYIEQMHKTFGTSLMQITTEVNKLKSENENFIKQCKVYLSKIDPLQIHDSLNGTFLSDVSQISNIKKEHSPTKARHSNPSSKINIQNLVINKKVQIAKNISKLRINTINNSNSNITNETHNPKSQFSHNNKSTSPNTSFSHNSKYRIKTPNRIRIDSKHKSKFNKHNFNINSHNNSISNTHLNKPKRMLPSTFKKNNSINDIRKLSIVDIPSINGILPQQENANVKRDSSFDYLYGNKQKILLILAKSGVVPLNMRLMFLEPIQFVYSYHNLKNDCLELQVQKEKEVALMKKEFTPFGVSTTIQVLFNFISKENENAFYNEYISLSENSKDKCIIQQILNIIEMVFECKDLINKAYSIKNTLFKVISHKRVQLNYAQLHSLHITINEYPDIKSDIYLGVQSQKNKMNVLLLLIVREVYAYSLIHFNNPSKTPMICYDTFQHNLTEYKNEINKLMNY